MAGEVGAIPKELISPCEQIPNSLTTPSELEEETQQDDTIDRIASRLLKENLILTALELHAELVENGRELPRLRDYFSNPGNFEKHAHSTTDTSPVLPRTSSVQTFDSLDFARYSDDGERQLDERVAVLEFELRKARETIKALRANLTVVTESDPNTPDECGEHVVAEEPLKPHEKRAVNFLVNEYLLKHNYKLTSITFSDENEDQDFEDWDDVGLNIPKPPELLHLYRNYCRHAQIGKETENTEVQTDLEWNNLMEEFMCERAELERVITNLHQQLERLTEENSSLVEEQKRLQKELNDSLNKVNSCNTSQISPPVQESPISPPANVTEIPESPAVEEMVISPDSTQEEPPHPPQMPSIEIPQQDIITKKQQDSSQDTLQNHKIVVETSRNLSPAFQRALLSIGLQRRIIHDNRLASEVNDIADSGEKVVLMLARCLPHIVPNVILAKREELIPVILATISSHPDSKERDKLLNILFNLIKKPDEEQRQMILTGFVAIAEHLGPTRVEAELLPQCWEQISHKYQERRLLVAESCGFLASYVAAEIRSSLLLSMLQQMLKEEKEESIREAASRSLAVLLAFVEDSDKFSQSVDLTLLTISDNSVGTVEVGLTVLLPTVAAWALELNKLENTLLQIILKALEDQLKALSQKSSDGASSPTPLEEQHTVHLIRALHALIPFLFVQVFSTGPYVDKISYSDEELPCELEVDRLPLSQSPLLDPVVIVGDGHKVAALVKAFDLYISEEWYKTWPSFDWVVNTFLPLFLNMLSYVEPHSRSTVHALSEVTVLFCQLFGWIFTQTKVKPLFTSIIKMCEGDSDTNNPSIKVVLTNAVVPVYSTGVLTSFCQDADKKELIVFLQELICTVSFCHVSLTSIQCAILELSANVNYHEVLLAVLWDGVVHTSALVRSNAARLFELLIGVVSENLLKTRVAPALVTLASDPEISVRVATVCPFGTIMALSNQKELLDKAQMQLQTFLDDPVYRDQHLMQMEMIQMFATVGPNTEPRFRDEFVLPRLAALAARNNQSTNESRKLDITLALLEAYTSLSCTFIPEQLIAEAFLPGLRCVLQDVRQVSPNHENTVISMIREFESKLDFSKSQENRTHQATTSPMASMEEMRRKMTKIFTAPPTNARANLPNIFQLRKK